jgi:NifU-like protein involved in Fe-S cluster formation
MELGIYNARMLRLAAEAKGAGRLKERDASAEILNPVCGDRIRVDLRTDGARIAALGYEVHACVLTQASASLLGRHAVDRTAAEIRDVAGCIEAMLREGTEAPGGDWSDYAALAPVRAHSSRHQCVMLPLRALLAALDASESPDRGS